MVMWLKNSDNIFTAELIQKLDISDLEAVISSSRRIKWFGHIKRGDTWTARVSALGIDGQTPRGRPRKTWAEVIQSDLREYGLIASHVLDRTQWKGTVRTTTMQRHIRLEVESTT